MRISSSQLLHIIIFASKNIRTAKDILYKKASFTFTLVVGTLAIGTPAVGKLADAACLL